MAKYIGTYATSGDVQSALDNMELSRPFIAYTTDNEKVIYGPNVDRAEVGDIVVYSVADDLLHYIKKTDYNTTNYPSASYVPVGVVAYPQTDDAILGPSGEITFMGLNWLDKNNPDNGVNKPNALAAWGFSNFDIPELTNYANITEAATDFNGKANTEIVLQYATAQTDWRTASAITWNNVEGCYPVFECAWRYHTSGTSQGDWFVPACGHVYFLWENTTAFEQLNSGLTLLNAYPYAFTGDYGANVGTSTEFNAGNAWNWWGKSAFRGTFKNFESDFSGRPYCSKLMTRI